MHLIGTSGVVYKVGCIKSKPDGEQWPMDMVKSMVGSPQQPQPGVSTRRVTTFATKKLDADGTGAETRFQPPSEPILIPRNV